MTADNTSRKAHWDETHRTIAAGRRSWYEEYPSLSLDWIRSTECEPSARIIDVGGGTSRFVDHLVRRGFHHVTVLDISPVALHEARQRLGSEATAVTWLEADITTASFEHAFDVWHDRAVFHFLVEPADRRAYVDRLREAVAPGGHVLIATFALDGPRTCNHLPVMRYTPTTLQYALSPEFQLLEARIRRHRTPATRTQGFVYCAFRRTGAQRRQDRERAKIGATAGR